MTFHENFVIQLGNFGVKKLKIYQTQNEKHELYFYVQNDLFNLKTDEKITDEEFLNLLKEHENKIKKYSISGKSKIGKSFFLLNFINEWSNYKFDINGKEIIFYFNNEFYDFTNFVEDLLNQNYDIENGFFFDCFILMKLIQENNLNLYIFIDNIKNSTLTEYFQEMSFNGFFISRNVIENFKFEYFFEFKGLNDDFLNLLAEKHNLRDKTYERYCNDEHAKILQIPLIANSWFNYLKKSHVTEKTRIELLELIFLSIKRINDLEDDENFELSIFKLAFLNHFKAESKENIDTEKIDKYFSSIIYIENGKIKYIHEIFEEFFIYKYLVNNIELNNQTELQTVRRLLESSKLSIQFFKILQLLFNSNKDFADELFNGSLKLRKMYDINPILSELLLENSRDIFELELEDIFISDAILTIVLEKYGSKFKNLSFSYCKFNLKLLFTKLRENKYKNLLILNDCQFSRIDKKLINNILKYVKPTKNSENVLNSISFFRNKMDQINLSILLNRRKLLPFDQEDIREMRNYREFLDENLSAIDSAVKDNKLIMKERYSIFSELF